MDLPAVVELRVVGDRRTVIVLRFIGDGHMVAVLGVTVIQI